MSNEVKKAVIALINDKIRGCKSDEDYIRLATQIAGSKTSKKKLYETLGLEPVEEVKEPTPAPAKKEESTEAPKGEDKD